MKQNYTKHVSFLFFNPLTTELTVQANWLSVRMNWPWVNWHSGEMTQFTSIYTWWVALAMSSLAMRSATSFPCSSSLFCLAALSCSLNAAQDFCANMSLACCTRSWALSIYKIGFYSLLRTIHNMNYGENKGAELLYLNCNKGVGGGLVGFDE